jgi:hypothetical protein
MFESLRCSLMVVSAATYARTIGIQICSREACKVAQDRFWEAESTLDTAV